MTRMAAVTTKESHGNNGGLHTLESAHVGRGFRGPRFGDHTGGFLQAWPVVRFPAIRATPLLFLATPLPQTPYELPRPTTGTGTGTDGHRLGRLAFGTVMAGYVAYACLFIYRTSFVVSGERYFSLFDDAMISMRYGRNLAHGYGLVWNPGGERVEGYTNPLWVLYMAAVHLLPLPPSKTSLIVQATAAVLLVANLVLVRRIALMVSNGSEAVAFGGVVLTACYLPLNNWSLQGTEVSLLLPVVSLCTWLALCTLGDRKFRALPHVVLGFSTLIRPDMVAPLVALTAFLAIADADNRRRHLAWGSAALVLFVLLQTAQRISYFGDILPNTYYLKMTGYPTLLRISRGAFVLAAFVWKFNVLLFALPFVVLRRHGRDARLLLFMLIVQMAYSVYVGGDAWEYWGGSNRYISIAMPGFLVALSWSLLALARTFPPPVGPGSVVVANRVPGAFFALLLVCLVSINSIYGPSALEEALLVHPPLHTGPGDENHEEVEEALALRQITTNEATIAVVRAGTIPYFADRPSIDLLGKNDRVIAHEPSRVTTGRARFVDFRPGHSKFDYRYSIELLTPDIVVQLWSEREQIEPFLHRFYTNAALRGHCVYLRKASTQVLWQYVPPGGCPGAR